MFIYAEIKKRKFYFVLNQKGLESNNILLLIKELLLNKNVAFGFFSSNDIFEPLSYTDFERNISKYLNDKSLILYKFFREIIKKNIQPLSIYCNDNAIDIIDWQHYFNNVKKISELNLNNIKKQLEQSSYIKNIIPIKIENCDFEIDIKNNLEILNGNEIKIIYFDYNKIEIEGNFYLNSKHNVINFEYNWNNIDKKYHNMIKSSIKKEDIFCIHCQQNHSFDTKLCPNQGLLIYNKEDFKKADLLIIDTKKMQYLPLSKEQYINYLYKKNDNLYSVRFDKTIFNINKFTEKNINHLTNIIGSKYVFDI